MIGWLFALLGLIIAVSLLIVDESAARENGHVLINTTLPEGASEDERVREIVARFKKSYRTLAALAVVASIPLVLLQAYPSLLILGFFIWIAVVLWVNSRIVLTYSGQMAELKKQNGWLVGKQHVVTVDTEVIMSRKTMPVSGLWLIPSLLISLTPLAHGLLTGRMDVLRWSLGSASVVTALVYLYLYRLSSRQRVTTYSADSRVNMACNRISIHMKTLCWVVLAALYSVSMAVLYALAVAGVTDMALIISIIIGDAFISIAMIYWVFGRIRRLQARLLSVAGEPLVTDEDEYWKGGFYNNPNDTRTMVEKRMGYGYTVNMATARGKAFVYGTLGGAAVILLTVIVLFMVMDSASFSMNVEGGRVVIDAPLYGYDFAVDEIRDMTLVDTLPEGTRTNGAATSRYLLGNFRLDGYGKSMMYVYLRNPPYLVIRLQDTTVFINGKTEEQTQGYYEWLTGEINDGK